MTVQSLAAAKSVWPSAIAVALLAGIIASSRPVFAASTASSSAYGEAVNVTLVPVLGGGVTIASGPLPQVTGNAPPAYSHSKNLASILVASPATGTLLSTGLLVVDASSTVPTSDQSAADAEVDNPGIFVAGLLPLLTISADQITSTAKVSGPCGTGLTAAGTSVLTNARLGGVLSSGLTILTTPNYELINVAGIRVVLNEQIEAGDGVTTKTIAINAIHVYLNNALLTGLGLLTGDIVIAHSQAALDCNGLPNAADLTITKSGSPNPVTLGQNLTYAITVSNRGPNAASDVVVTDPLPAGVTFVSDNPSQGTCNGASTVVCNLGTLNVGAYATVTFVVQPTRTGTILNSAIVSSSTTDTNPNNTASTTTTVNPAGGGSQASLAIGKSAAPNPVTVGNQLNYSILVTNSGPDSAANVVVSDTLPAGVNFVSANPSQGTCSGTATVVCNLATLGAGASASIAIAVVPTQLGTIVNTATVSSSTTDTNPNNQASISTTVNPAGGSNQADLSITKTAAPTTVTVGAQLNYTMVINNAGPSDASNVVVSDTLPAGVSFVSAIPTQGNCSGISTVVCNLGLIAAGASASIAIAVVPTQAGTIVNNATVSGSNPDPNPANNHASTTTTVSPAGSGNNADLSITKVASPNPVLVGGNLGYTVTVHNNGPAGATGVVVSDPLPATVTLVSAKPSQGSCSGTRTVLCSLGPVAADASATVAIRVHPTAPGDIVNTATVSSRTSDPGSTDNTATVTTHVNLAVGSTPQCRIDDIPAATLLIPYFAVDLSSSSEVDTYFSVVNSAAAPHLASVTLWSDWAIPVFTFNVYLTGYGVQAFDLRSILLTGKVPPTGPALGNPGGLSDPNQNFPGCDPSGVAGPPARPGFLQRALTGQRIRGACFSSPRSTAMATGYITVDAVNSCSALNPSSPGYFGNGGTAIASDDNVLLGEYSYVNPGAGFADGDSAVQITADPAAFGAGKYTFYARYVEGSGIDNRQPLGTLYGARFLTSGQFKGTEYTVWRDTKSPDAVAVTCGAEPSWAPLNSAPVAIWDEQEHNSGLATSSDRLPWATQVISVGSAALPVTPAAGWLWLDLSHAATPLFGDVAQGWVTVLRTFSAGPYTVGHRAWRLDSVCDFFQ